MKRAVVDFDKKQATVAYEAGNVSFREMVEALAEAGFPGSRAIEQEARE